MFAPRPRLILSIVLLHSFLGRYVESQVKTTVSPLELVKTTIQNELNRAGDREVRWRHLLYKQAEGKQEQGSGGNPIGVTRTPIALAGKPLSGEEQHDEMHRILRLSRDRAEQQKLNKPTRRMRNNARLSCA